MHVRQLGMGWSSSATHVKDRGSGKGEEGGEEGGDGGGRPSMAACIRPARAMAIPRAAAAAA